MGGGGLLQTLESDNTSDLPSLEETETLTSHRSLNTSRSFGLADSSRLPNWTIDPILRVWRRLTLPHNLQTAVESIPITEQEEWGLEEETRLHIEQRETSLQPVPVPTNN